MKQSNKYKVRYKQQLLLLFTLLLFSNISYSQEFKGIWLNGEKNTIKISMGDSLYIKGSLKAQDKSFIKNWGDIFITDSLVNRNAGKLFEIGAFAGTFHYLGKKKFLINGDSVAFIHFAADSTKVLIPENDMIIYGDFLFENDSINLIGGINLKSRIFFTLDENGDSSAASQQVEKRGRLFNEDNNKMFYNEPSDTGYIYVDYINSDNVFKTGIRIATVLDDAIAIDVTRFHNSINTIVDGSIRKSYTIIPDGAGDAAIDFYYFDNDFSATDYNEEDFKLWYRDDQYEFTKMSESTVDTEKNVVISDFGEKLPLIEKEETIITIADHICDSLPYLEFENDSAFICSGAITQIQPDSTDINNEFLWYGDKKEFLGNSLIFEIDSAGTYHLMVTDDRGCFNIDSIKVGHKFNPIASFDITFDSATTCEYDSVYFTNLSSTGNQNDSLSYIWDFGLETISFEENPAILYPDSGKYIIRLHTETKFGCTDSFDSTLIIHPEPIPAFTTGKNCSKETVEFKNLSTVGDTSVVNEYTWVFGDDSDTTYNESLNHYYEGTTHTYTEQGQYNLQFKIRVKNTGCIGILDTLVNVYPDITANFSFQNACSSDSVLFENLSVSDSTIEFFEWTFGDGQTSLEKNPIIRFDTSGLITVELYTGFSDGCTHTHTEEIRIHPVPELTFTANDACQYSDIIFVSETTPNTLKIKSYQWDFGNGETSGLKNPDVKYTGTGVYNVKLIAVSDSSCTDTAEMQITVHPKPTADFSADNVCFGDQTNFVNASVVYDNTSSYTWQFDPLHSVIDSIPSYQFESEGEHEVTLLTRSMHNCSDTISKNIVVDSLPPINLADTISTCVASIDVNAGDPSYTYLWDTGGSTNIETFTTNGEYSVTVTNLEDCINSADFVIVLNDEVRPSLGGDQTACNTLILNAHNDGSIYEWSVPGETDQYLTVTQSGTYWVTVTDIYNCEGSETVEITINESPIVDLGPDINACIGTPEILTAITPNDETIEWSTGVDTQSISVSLTDYYGLTLTNSDNCSAQDIVHVQFHTPPSYPFGEDYSTCYVDTLDALNIGCSYLWFDGSANRTLPVNESGTYSVQISNPGCTISDTILFNFAGVILDLGDDINLCEGKTLNLDAGNPGSDYYWSTGSNNQSINITEDGFYDITITNSTGCMAYDGINLTIIPGPVFNFSENMTICNDEAVIIDPNTIADSYAWYNSDGQFSSASFISVDVPGIYWLLAQNGNGCAHSDTVNVDKNPNTIEADFLVASEINTNDTIQILDMSLPGTGYYYWDFGDGKTSTAIDPLHVYFQAGDYIITQNIENGGCSSTLSKDVTVSNASKNLFEEEFIISAQKETKIKNVNLYPNPNRGNFICDIKLSEEYTIYMTIYDLNGTMLYHNKLKNQTHSVNEFSFRHLAAGLYILKVNVEEEQKVMKFIKY